MSLILTREVGQVLEVGSPWGHPTTLRVVDITNKQVRVEIDGPKDVPVNRGEVADAIRARTELEQPTDAENFSLAQYLREQSKWSQDTFGPGPMVESLLDHIRKEITEVSEAPGDVVEWVDIAMLALDGALRCGVTPAEVIATLAAKFAVVKERQWPAAGSTPPGEAICHIKTESDTAAAAA
ncbi:DUF550 domain-containing protein [Pseudoxanthomonas sp. LjRoot168]|uniref:dATP/dGTP pyrophosphohydrolase domain-containing protein n=1 Tax=unclassified Pseudoxanthomonas TaxID=2645906 RepID=UPI003ED0B0A8